MGACLFSLPFCFVLACSGSGETSGSGGVTTGGSGGVTTGGSGGVTTGGSGGVTTGGSGGASGSGAQGSGGEGACAGLPGCSVCGVDAGATCEAGFVCRDLYAAACGAKGGQSWCMSANMCGSGPVCGCNGKTYASDCIAYAKSIDVMGLDQYKACVPGNGASGANCFTDGDCQSGLKCCASSGVPGSPIACLTPDTGGQCPALP